MADADPTRTPDVILMVSGTEVGLAVSAYERLKHAGVNARVSIEQASTMGWDRYVGSKGKAIRMSTFGASAPLKGLVKKFGFTLERVVSAACEVMA